MHRFKKSMEYVFCFGFATGFELILKILESYSTKKWVLFVDFQNKSMVNRIKQLPDVPYYHEKLIKLTFGNDA
jgi:hypothetical protein